MYYFLMQLGEYPVVTKSYDHEFLKSNSVTTFPQIMLNNYGLVPYNNGVIMIKKPISPNFDYSNRFLTDYIPQNFAFTYAYVATPGA